MFKIKNNPSPNYVADLFKLSSCKGLRSTCSYFLEYFLIVPRLNLHFLAVSPFMKLFPPNLTAITSLLSFCKGLISLLFKQFVAERS